MGQDNSAFCIMLFANCFITFVLIVLTVLNILIFKKVNKLEKGIEENKQRTEQKQSSRY